MFDIQNAISHTHNNGLIIRLGKETFTGFIFSCGNADDLFALLVKCSFLHRTCNDKMF